MKRKLTALKKFIFRFGNKHYKLDRTALADLSRIYKLPRLYFACSYIYCCYHYGCDMRQYMLFEMYKLKHRERRMFVTRYNKFRLFRRFNWRGKEQRVYFDDKYKFNVAFSQFIHRKWLYAPENTADDIQAFVQGRDRIVVKPTGAMGGEGVSVFATQEIDIGEFAQKAQGEKLLLEQYVEQCQEIAALNSSSVNTLRLVSVRDDNDQVHIVSASLRVGRDGSWVDNLSAGGVLYPLDADSGYVNGAGVDAQGNEYYRHNELVMLGYQIPRWQHVTALAKEAMDVFPDIRLVAWDICLTPHGVELIEGNLMPGARSLQADKQGKKELMLQLLD